MNESETYEFDEHQHRYACWTAARAVQRSFVKTPVIYAAICQTSMRDFVGDSSPLSQESFDLLHENWCMTMIAFFSSLEIPCSFGRAAKIVAIYLKTAVIIPSGGKGVKVAVIHPPIDRILLTTIAAKFKDVKLPAVPWTQLSFTDYQVIRQEILKHVGYFDWRTEAYWNISGDKIESNGLTPLKMQLSQPGRQVFNRQ